MLTENYAALPIVQQELHKKGEEPVVIFGSSFPKDQEYTQVPMLLIVTQCQECQACNVIQPLGCKVIFKLTIYLSIEKFCHRSRVSSIVHISGLPGHQSNQGVHGNREDSNTVELREPLRKSV